MKRIFLFSLIFLFFVYANAQSKVNDREFQKFKGKVKSVVTSYSYYENKDGKMIEKLSGNKFESLFDENGNLFQTQNFVVGDRNVYSTIDGEKTFKTFKIEGVGGSGGSSTNTQNKPKNLDERYSMKFTYKYDKGKIIEEYIYSNDGTLFSKTIYKYDKNGNIEETAKYNSNGLTTQVFFKFDDENNVIEQKIVFPNLKPNGSVTVNSYSNYKFDAQGNWTDRDVSSKYSSNENKVLKTIDHRKITYYEN